MTGGSGQITVPLFSFDRFVYPRANRLACSMTGLDLSVRIARFHRLRVGAYCRPATGRFKTHAGTVAMFWVIQRIAEFRATRPRRKPQPRDRECLQCKRVPERLKNTTCYECATKTSHKRLYLNVTSTQSLQMWQ
jgi:hypothetical protein